MDVPAAKPSYYTVREVAQIMRLSESTVRRWIKEGTLPTVQLRGKRSAIRIPADAINRLPNSSPSDPSGLGLLQPDPISSLSPPTKRKGPRPKWLSDPSPN